MSEEGTLLWKLISVFGSFGSIITGFKYWWSTRGVLKFYRDKNMYNKFNKVYGPLLIEVPKCFYIYITFCLFNERRKILVKDIKCSVKDVYNQETVQCEVINEPPQGDDSDSCIKKRFWPCDFPEEYQCIGAINKREILKESARDYFLALRCPGFRTVIPTKNEQGGIDFNCEVVDHYSLDLNIDFTTSRGKTFNYNTEVYFNKPDDYKNKEKINL